MNTCRICILCFAENQAWKNLAGFDLQGFWWSIGESNPWPRQCECRALPTVLMPRIGSRKLSGESSSTLPSGDMGLQLISRKREYSTGGAKRQAFSTIRLRKFHNDLKCRICYPRSVHKSLCYFALIKLIMLINKPKIKAYRTQHDKVQYEIW